MCVWMFGYINEGNDKRQTVQFRHKRFVFHFSDSEVADLIQKMFIY